MENSPLYVSLQEDRDDDRTSCRITAVSSLPLEELAKSADEALCEAKSTGRNRIIIHASDASGDSSFC